jgi:hypothetical protein
VIQIHFGGEIPGLLPQLDLPDVNVARIVGLAGDDEGTAARWDLDCGGGHLRVRFVPAIGDGEVECSSELPVDQETHVSGLGESVVGNVVLVPDAEGIGPGCGGVLDHDGDSGRRRVQSGYVNVWVARVLFAKGATGQCAVCRHAERPEGA